ncbi:MAG: glucan 1,4-alpha-glucosidase, partial [Burkholderiales bacterium]|nr:glucan 1,4-alpha-glucosidase [Burkholderiales bacterium]
ADRSRVVLAAERAPFALALAAVDRAQKDAWEAASAGYVGASDGWQDFARNGRMSWIFQEAGPGNVALLGKLPTYSVLALAFAPGMQSAATLAISALAQRFETVWRAQAESWRGWHFDKAHAHDIEAEFGEQMHLSAMVLKAHQDKGYPGAMVASLSIPWGNRSDDVGGYHLIWPRDLVESAGALLALGAVDEAQDTMRYLVATQLEDGRWAQNQWLGGTPRWVGIQLDEVAFPVLLAYELWRRDALNGIEVADTVRRALGFIVRQGPASDQDRWEENSGVNAFTLAIAIAALVCGAELLDTEVRHDLLLLADDWNSHIEAWCVASGTSLSDRYGVPSYYIRGAPGDVIRSRDALNDMIPIRNRADGLSMPAFEHLSTDFLQLVRFGLRSPEDPVVQGTVRIVDRMLRRDTPSGPGWFRYNGDGYGEHAEGAPYDGTGRGRLWPLLTGERGHFALAAGQDARPYLRAMNRMSARSGLIPEQVWDDRALPGRKLFPGRPTGSAMPLVWAHAEFVKLAASIAKETPVDRPEALWLRYQAEVPRVDIAHWTPRMPVTTIREGQQLRILRDTSVLVHWGVDGWDRATDTPSTPGVLGLHVTDLPTRDLRVGQTVAFTCRSQADGTWEGIDHTVAIATAAAT